VGEAPLGGAAEPLLGGIAEPPLGGVAEPALGGVGEPPLGRFVPADVLAEASTVVPPESMDTDVEATVASTCDPLGPAVTPAPVETAGVEAEVEADICEGAALTLDSVEATGVEVEVEAEIFEGVALALDSVEAGGADTVVEIEPAGGAVLAPALTVAVVAGVLAVVVADTEGVEEVETSTVVEAETLGVWGVPGRPSACAGTATDRHPTAHTAAQLKKRKRCVRGITSTRSRLPDAAKTTEIHATRNFLLC
jgi:hypothetical protein